MFKPRLLAIFLAVVLLASLTGCATAVQTPTVVPIRTATQLMNDLTPSIVRVRTADSQGTGFVAFGVGQVLTAFHVIGNISTILTVVASDGKEYRAKVLGADEERDLALLSVPGLASPPLVLGSSVAAGDMVYAIGYAAGLEGEASITQGIISAKRVESETGLAYLQTDAAINPGNSGGPLLNEIGEVVGVNVSRLRGEMAQFENMGFAISVEEVRSVSEALQAGEVNLLPAPSPTPTLAPVPTTTPASISEWCVFEAKVFEFAKADEAFRDRWNERIKQESFTSDDWQTWANEYVDVYNLACTLPRSPVAARPIADKLCASAESMSSYLRHGGGDQWDYLRIQYIQGITEAGDMIIDVNTQFGNPSCE